MLGHVGLRRLRLENLRIEGPQDSRGGLLDSLAGRLDTCDGLFAATGPRCDVTEGVGAAVEPDPLADDVCHRLSLQLGVFPAVELLVEEGVGNLVVQGLHLLSGRVPPFHPDAVIPMRAVAIRRRVELVLDDREPDAPRELEENVVGACRIISIEPAAYGRKLFAVSLRNIEHGDELEASDNPIILAALGISPLVQHRGENPDGLFSLADEAIHRPPSVESCYPSRRGALGGDEERVPVGVTVKSALEAQVTLPILGRREVADPLRQCVNEFRVVVFAGHLESLQLVLKVHPQGPTETGVWERGAGIFRAYNSSDRCGRVRITNSTPGSGRRTAQTLRKDPDLAVKGITDLGSDEIGPYRVPVTPSPTQVVCPSLPSRRKVQAVSKGALLPAIRSCWPMQETGPGSPVKRWENVLYRAPAGYRVRHGRPHSGRVRPYLELPGQAV